MSTNKLSAPALQQPASTRQLFSKAEGSRGDRRLRMTTQKARPNCSHHKQYICKAPPKTPR
jgi:hypothetical protein